MVFNPWDDGKIGTITDTKENWYSYPVTKYTLYLIPKFSWPKQNLKALDKIRIIISLTSYNF